MEVVYGGGLEAVLVVSVPRVLVDDRVAPAALLVLVEEDAVVLVVLPAQASVVVEAPTTAAG